MQGRYDFTLTWTPDETQFASFGVRIPTSTDPNAPPVLFTAVQEQLGLKFDSVRAPVEVLVIDRVEKPSENYQPHRSIVSLRNAAASRAEGSTDSSSDRQPRLEFRGRVRAVEAIEQIPFHRAERRQRRPIVVGLLAETLHRQGLSRAASSDRTWRLERSSRVDLDLPARRGAIVGVEPNRDAIGGANSDR